MGGPASAQNDTVEQYPEVETSNTIIYRAALEVFQQAVKEERWNDAVVAGTRAYEAAIQLESVSASDRGDIAFSLARIQNKRKDWRESVRWFEIAIVDFENAHGPKSTELYRPILELTTVLLGQSEWKKGRHYFNKLQKVTTANYKRPSNEYALMFLTKGDLLLLELYYRDSVTPQDTQEKKTLSAYRSAQRDFAALGDKVGVGDAYFRIGKLHTAFGRTAKSRRYYRDALASYKEAGLAPGDERVIRSETFLAVAYAKSGRDDEATEILRRVALNQAQVERKELTPVYRVNPEYPSHELQRGVEGWVHVRFTVTVTGSVADVIVVDADPPKVFNAAAIEAVSKWRYIPLVKDGVLIAGESEVVLSFKVVL